MRDLEQTAWNNCHPNDLWIFDKLLLSKRLGYTCGPHGVDVPQPDNYVIRPCVNLMGMGRGAHIRRLEGSTDNTLDPGTFWCEIFTGRHLSVDYRHGKQVLCVEGFKLESENNLSSWVKWEKTNDKIPFPAILKDLWGEYEYINVEFIGDKIIEVHLRQNPDFLDHNSNYIIPAYGITQLDGHKFIPQADYTRIGFFIPE